MRQRAKLHLGYIGNRPGKDGEVLDRTLFGKGFGAYTPEQVQQLIEQAPDNTLFWRLILNPDPVLENAGKSLDLRALTADAVRWLEKRLGTEKLPRDIPFVAAIHDDHSPKAHVHGILFMRRQGREKPIQAVETYGHKKQHRQRKHKRNLHSQAIERVLSAQGCAAVRQTQRQLGEWKDEKSRDEDGQDRRSWTDPRTYRRRYQPNNGADKLPPKPTNVDKSYFSLSVLDIHSNLRNGWIVAARYINSRALRSPDKDNRFNSSSVPLKGEGRFSRG